jgi:hypothetical protein
MIDMSPLISATLKQMNLSEDSCKKVLYDLDELKVNDIYPFLEAQFSSTMAIAGEWGNANSRGVDVYDLALKFVEDKFTRARVKKSYSGWYLLIATEPLKNETNE